MPIVECHPECLLRVVETPSVIAADRRQNHPTGACTTASALPGTGAGQLASVGEKGNPLLPEACLAADEENAYLFGAKEGLQTYD